jgi:hypothetical protein
MVCEACVRAGASVVFVVTTSKADYAAARSRRLVVFHNAEWAALTLAAEFDRLTAPAFGHWLATKQSDPSWALTANVALGAYVSAHDRRALNVQAVLRACGAQLVNVSGAAVAAGEFWHEPT